MRGRALRVRASDAEVARRAMARSDLLDPGRRPRARDGWVLLPLAEGAGTSLDIPVEHQVVEADLEERAARPSSLRDAPGLPPELASEMTRSMDVVGDVAVLRLKEGLRPRAGEIGRALMEAQPRLRAVAVDDGVKGELRVRSLTLVAGEGPLTTLHREHGLTLELDLERAYFSPRLATEHRRVAGLVTAGERVLDMFAGVGPFSILIARLAEPSEVHAVDLNPAAARLARSNAERNGVSRLVTVHQGDAREVVPGLGRFDRVVMNHPHGAVDLLDVALGASRGDTVIHLHIIGTHGEAEGAAGVADRLGKEAGLGGVAATGTREVRTYAPGVSHWCLDLTIAG